MKKFEDALHFWELEDDDPVVLMGIRDCNSFDGNRYNCHEVFKDKGGRELVICRFTGDNEKIIGEQGLEYLGEW